MIPEALEPYWRLLGTRFSEVEAVFVECMEEAQKYLSEDGIESYLECAAFLGKMGRGVEPLLTFLEEAPRMAVVAGEDVMPEVRDFAFHLSCNTNGPAIVPFLQTLAPIAERLKSRELFVHYLEMIRDFAERTSTSVHGGGKATIPSPSLPDLLMQIPRLLSIVTLEGLQNWINYGIRHYHDHPERQRDFFQMQSADAHAVIQRERHGCLFIDHERMLDLYLQGFWQEDERLIPYSLAFDELRKPMPYYDETGIRIPDVYDDRALVSGIDRYRLALAHMAGHRRWSEAMIADNWSPFQRVAVELFEDCRIDTLVCRRYPGLRPLILALHPRPDPAALETEEKSTIRLRLAMISRGLLDRDYLASLADETMTHFAERFDAVLAEGDGSSREMAELGLLFIARTRRESDFLPRIIFEDTEVDYRDDNRHLWMFIEAGEDEPEDEAPRTEAEEEEVPQGLPPRHYDEWDYTTQTYRPDWVSLYELLHPTGSASDIDRLLDKHAALAKRLKRLLDLVKPQERVRIRYQEEGSELDLDVALRSIIDYKSGAEPDPRINMSHRTDGRNIAVSLLLDLSESLSEPVKGGEQTLLELSREAVSLLAWSIEQLGDPLAIGGFHSNTRHDVRYMHLKGFSEHWDDQVKARLAAMDAGYSTRMGAAMRHAAHYLKAQPADKKLLLVLTDGEPADIDVKDGRMLIEDAHRAVQELDMDGIYSYCINLDPAADEYVSDIFGQQYSIIDHVERLPERLPELFLSLTR